MSKNIFILLSFPFSSKLLMLKSKCQVCAQKKKQFCRKCGRTNNSHIFDFSLLLKIPNDPIFNLWGSKEPIRPIGISLEKWILQLFSGRSNRTEIRVDVFCSGLQHISRLWYILKLRREDLYFILFSFGLRTKRINFFKEMFH